MLETLCEFFSYIFAKKHTLTIEENVINSINDFIIKNNNQVFKCKDMRLKSYVHVHKMNSKEIGEYTTLVYNIIYYNNNEAHIPVYKYITNPYRDALEVFNLDEDVLREMGLRQRKLFRVK